VDIKWKDGNVSQFTVYSGLGGNLRIRSFIPLQDAVKRNNKFTLTKGENPNPFFWVNKIKEPEISPDAEPRLPVLKDIYEYDVVTEPGELYTFTADE
jgi:alpha-L-fucosidase 2